MLLDKSNENFLFLGASPATNAAQYEIAVPYPTVGGACFETARMVDAARNARGEMVGRMAGRSLDKQNMTWDVMPCDKWWALNRWFENGHFTFYCHYFNHNLGMWQTRLFYLGDVKTNPVHVNGKTGVPAYYTGATFNVIDCGVV
ncbi:MAG: hypothetical protein RR900_06540 [Ruthenibacterium sp.]